MTHFQKTKREETIKVKAATASSAMPFGGLVILIVVVLLIGANSGM